MEMEHQEHGRQPLFPNLGKVYIEMWAAVLGVVLVFLPSVLLRLASFSKSAYTADSSFVTAVTAPAFANGTLIIGLILSIYALARSKNDVAVRTMAIIGLIVCVIRFILAQ